MAARPKYTRSTAIIQPQQPGSLRPPAASRSTGQFSTPAQLVPPNPNVDQGRIDDFLNGIHQYNKIGWDNALASTAVIMGAALGWTAYKRARGK